MENLHSTDAIPEVAFLIPPRAIKALRRIANPCFRSWILRFVGSSQSSFCVYTLLPISARDELNFGRP